MSRLNDIRNFSRCIALLCLLAGCLLSARGAQAAPGAARQAGAEVLVAAGPAGATVAETQPGPAEAVVRLLTSPLVATLLVALGLLLLVADVLVGGLGWLSLGGLALLALCFWGHALAGLAGWMLLAIIALLFGGLTLLLRQLPSNWLLRGLVLNTKVGAVEPAISFGAAKERRASDEELSWPS